MLLICIYLPKFNGVFGLSPTNKSLKSTPNCIATMTETHRKTILITGASGFLATHVVKAFLRQGYYVRGTVRSDQAAANVRKGFSQYSGRLSFAIVEDIAQPGAFNEAVKGVDGIVHTASPFQTSVQDNKRDLLWPAINGTTSILRAAQEYAPQINRVVITSSMAAVIDAGKGPQSDYTYTEEDWNPMTFEQAERANGLVAYAASKAIAEQAAWRYMETNMPHFSLTTICPPMIYGPVEHHVPTMAKLNTSADDIYRLFNGSSTEIPSTILPVFADVRDVAQAHLSAFESQKAAGERFIVSSGGYTYQEVCDILRSVFPEVRDKVPIGQPGQYEPAVIKVSSNKIKTLLGITFHTLQETVKDTADSLLALEEACKAY
ncbi:putative oxidoreductase [Aspergillus bombycis]|uniref:Putative oxidoreductase n=1 Tax=Aspergillus bombycis TaxID=109264 RepID=A0A1F8ADH0_9EURO|nr:putative oxidoreductase [Aspergillus bombycis]OGM49701.1 putative oxidoreductase [Aspergillus bombycis]